MDVMSYSAIDEDDEINENDDDGLLMPKLFCLKTMGLMCNGDVRR